MRESNGNPGLYREVIPENEAVVIQRFTKSNTRELVRDYPENIRPVRRRLHAKHHGCVHAQFRVCKDIPMEFRQGIFAQSNTFPALIRLSNGFKNIQHDKEKDARGMAIKLLGVPGRKVMEDESNATTQDFLLLNSNVFFIRNAEHFERFSNAVDIKKPIRYFFPWNPMKWEIHEALSLLKSIIRTIHNPLAEQYWSAAACRMGEKAVKFTIVPRARGGFVTNDRKSPNYLRQAMVEQLKRGSVDLDFMAQLQVDPIKMPIEDPTIAWSEKLSPFVKIAEIHIPAQAFEAAHLMTFCENLSFTAFHTLPEHMPLGGINRMRKAVYQSISETRHRLNEVPRREPEIDDLPEEWKQAFSIFSTVNQ
jgi:Catalase